MLASQPKASGRRCRSRHRVQKGPAQGWTVAGGTKHNAENIPARGPMGRPSPNYFIRGVSCPATAYVAWTPRSPRSDSASYTWSGCTMNVPCISVGKGCLYDVLARPCGRCISSQAQSERHTSHHDYDTLHRSLLLRSWRKPIASVATGWAHFSMSVDRELLECLIRNRLAHARKPHAALLKLWMQYLSGARSSRAR